jgi:drug/metabolite transporter (DMT)-like permease
MIWLFVSILSSAGLMLIFKSFDRWNIRVFPAIAVNYITCFVCGNILLGPDNLFSKPVWTEPWFIPIAALGTLFIGTFYLMGTATRLAGASATSVAGKMSVVIPAAYSILILNEQFSAWQGAGIFISLISVYMMRPETAAEHKNHKGLIMLGLVFLGSGLVDTGLNLLKNQYGAEVNDYKMSTIVFGMAGLLGITITALNKHKHLPGKKEVAGGILLGLVNYLSLVAMFGAIGHFKGSTAWFFAINNIGVVAVSTIGSVLFFRETINRHAWLGLALSAIAILLINFNALF